MNLFLIDGIGPFFRDDRRTRINWSKIPFDQIAYDGPARQAYFRQIRLDFEEFCRRVSAIGYNAVSLDDLAHLADHEALEPQVRHRIGVLREEFSRLFEIAGQCGLAVYITTDIVSYTPAIKALVGNSRARTIAFFRELVDRFLGDFPNVAGLILRIGESDGLDVTGDFRSELHLKSPAQVNRFLKTLLPVFEQRGRQMVFRTWTVGAYQVGDLLWHRRTFRRVLQGIDSPAIIVSMKFGESDFFRYLSLNGNFFRTALPTMIELQARREYEGCGEYPSFVGWDYVDYYRELAQAPNLVGISVWCQTGGWLPFRRLAFIGEGSVWTEINAHVTFKIFAEGASVEKALRAWSGGQHIDKLTELFQLSDEVINELLYIREFASLKLFFRRVRIPPLMGVYWNSIFVNHSLRKILGHYVRDPQASVREARRAYSRFARMRELAAACGLPVDDIVYMERTFEILLLAREYFLLPYDDDIRQRLKTAKRAYKKAYPKGSRPRYAVRLNFKPFRVRRRFVSWSLAIALRQRRGYRLVDNLFTLHLLSLVYHAFKRARPDWIPKFARKSAMGIDTIFH